MNPFNFLSKEKLTTHQMLDLARMETRLAEASTRQKEAESRMEEARRDTLRLQLEKLQLDLEKLQRLQEEIDRRFPVLFSTANLITLFMLTLTTFLVSHVLSLLIGVFIKVKNFHLLNFMLYIRPEISMFIMCSLYLYCDFLNRFSYKFITRGLDDQAKG